MTDTIKLYYGDGGSYTNELIKKVFIKNYGEVNTAADSFVFSANSGRLAFTTDSFVVKPLFFRGGDIGKLAVCGTINDLATAGAIPRYISAGFIIEEGFDIQNLCLIAKSMGEVCRKTGVKIVTGDTKVVEKGSADGVFINTSGIGAVSDYYNPGSIQPGDKIIITGPIAEHGTAILLDRYCIQAETDIKSDCSPLCHMISELNENLTYIKLMKDPTRGGLATILNEIAENTGYNIELNEDCIPIDDRVKAINELLGIDPLYLACEGRMVLAVNKNHADKILEHLRSIQNCAGSEIIGQFTPETRGIVYMNTIIGGRRMIAAADGQTIPRIC